MPAPAPTRLRIDPPIDQWRVTPRNGRRTPVIATGHQPTLWHPGILAKYIACDAFAQHVGGSTLNAVVEHNPLGCLSVDLPHRKGDALGRRRLTLDDRRQADTTPPNRLASLDAGKAIDALRVAMADERLSVAQHGLTRLAQAYTDLPDASNLAAQSSLLLDELSRPHLAASALALPTGDLVTRGFLERVLAEPVACACCYNRAALAYPEANTRPLYLGRDAVELPLWAQDKTTVTPVYADLGDSSGPLLFTTAHNRHLDLAAPDALRYLRPRAITLSAIMRSERCDLFIHGIGGGVYDQVTERWWRDWTGEDLAPKAVVSADVYLPFDAPTATPGELARAQWFAHHLPHNLDRYTEAKDEDESARRHEKRELLDHMNDDRNPRRRAKAFRRIHAINAALGDRHRARLDAARDAAAAARLGQANAAVAARRDWCFALYPDRQLNDLAERIRAGLDASRG